MTKKVYDIYWTLQVQRDKYMELSKKFEDEELEKEYKKWLKDHSNKQGGM